MADKAINWVGQQKALLPDKPFFMYFAPGATHAPHQVPAEWIEKYKGKFAHGWDRQREITFERQKELGVIPPDAVLTPRHAEIPAWDDMDPALKPALEREMEVYAAFMGVIIAQGGRFGGWSLYAKDGRAKFYYNVLGINSFSIDAATPVPTGKTQVRMEFAYDGGGMGKGGTVTLYCDGSEVGTGRVDQTQGVVFSADETTDVGRETGTMVGPDYTAHTSRFSGKIAWVQIDLGEDAKDADHYIDPDERFRIAMARQ